MTRVNVTEMTVSELVERFVAIALDQDQALLYDDYAKFNRLYKQMDAVRNELKRRPGDQRQALLPLYDHRNMQVRLKAAVTTLAVAPEAARGMLQIIANSRRQPQAGDAGMFLRRLGDGSFVPS